MELLARSRRSGEQLGAGRRELHITAALVQPQPALGDCIVEPRRYSAGVALRSCSIGRCGCGRPAPARWSWIGAAIHSTAELPTTCLWSSNRPLPMAEPDGSGF